MSTEASAAPIGSHYNILLLVTDQERANIPMPEGYQLPARERLAREGVSFTNHYITANMCTPSRASMLTGQHAPINGVWDNMDLPYIDTMSTDLNTTGKMMQQAGYATPLKGKWHLSKGLEADGSTNFQAALEPYGFTDFNYEGDRHGAALEGYFKDDVTIGDSISWLKETGQPLNEEGKPWCMTVTVVNPHDIMYTNADPPGETIQGATKLPCPITKPPNSTKYKPQWNMPLPASLTQSLDEQVGAIGEYVQCWSAFIGFIPPDRSDMWQIFQDFYYNLLRDSDDQLMQLLETLDELDMSRGTIIVFTSDHGELGGVHGGMRGKGPSSYEENIHVPFIIVHPDIQGGQECRAVTSHIDLAPTLVYLTGASDAQKAEITQDLPGQNMATLLAEPEKAQADTLHENGALFTYHGLFTLDGDFVTQMSETYTAEGKLPSDLRPDLSKRGFQRTVFDGRYKFSRYFSPLEFNTPETLEELLGFNDLELFDLENDPIEVNNLAADPDANQDLILAMNEKLNALIATEIGADNGDFLPDKIKNRKAVIMDSVDQFDP